MKNSAAIAFDYGDVSSGSLFTDLTTPSAYTGLYGFHKYWGKKPVEPLRALIQVLSREGDVIADPFLGSGAVAKETLILRRKFLGSDINPIALRLTKFFLQPCAKHAYQQALAKLREELEAQINRTYTHPQFGVASHLLWEEGRIAELWQRGGRGRRTTKRQPDIGDLQLSTLWDGYSPRLLRPLHLFNNSRINSKCELGWTSLFSGRALRNIELLLEKIRTLPPDVREAMELTLTAAVGQMSKMVFAISARRKVAGKPVGRTEVGSWVIGFWRPAVHFEINVWNCFEGRAAKLLKGLTSDPVAFDTASSVREVLERKKWAYLTGEGADALLMEIPDNSVQLFISDPPHGDRIPYLELSEMWNAILGVTPAIEREIVVSNAKGRNKGTAEYNARLSSLLTSCALKTKDGGFIVLLFNSRHQREWSALHALTSAKGVKLIGAMPLLYSATSVVQDNRPGSMPTDFIVVFGKGKVDKARCEILQELPNWVRTLPEGGQ